MQILHPTGLSMLLSTLVYVGIGVSDFYILDFNVDGKNMFLTLFMIPMSASIYIISYLRSYP